MPVLSKIGLAAVALLGLAELAPGQSHSSGERSREATQGAGKPSPRPRGREGVEAAVSHAPLSSSSLPDQRVRGFGNEFEGQPVADFGFAATESAKPPENWRSRYDLQTVKLVEDMLRRYDRDGSGALEQDEWG